MPNKINWGIIGLGNIASRFAADLQLSDLAVLYGVGSRDMNKAKSFGEKFNAVKCYGSYRALAEDPNIDIVYIATPHIFHCENTMMCLSNGKAVLCEKPMGMNAFEVKMMIKEAQSRNLFLMEGMWTRFIPAIEKLIELLDRNIIDELLSIRADFGFKSQLGPESRIYNKALGGGSLLDVGIYPIYISMITMGMPIEIIARAQMAKTGVDSSCTMLFNYANKSVANLESSIDTYTPIEAIIEGHNGSIKLHSPFYHAEKITISQYGIEEHIDIKHRGNGYIHEIEEVNNCFLNHETQSTKLPLQISLDLITIIDRVKEKIGLDYSMKS